MTCFLASAGVVVNVGISSPPELILSHSEPSQTCRDFVSVAKAKSPVELPEDGNTEVFAYTVGVAEAPAAPSAPFTVTH